MRSLVTLSLLVALTSCASISPYAAAAWSINKSDGNTHYCWLRTDHQPPKVGESEPLCYEPGYEPALSACQSMLRAKTEEHVSIEAAKGELIECMAASGWKREQVVITLDY